MNTIIRIEMSRDRQTETYYEPSLTPAVEDVLAACRQFGWETTIERVDAEEEMAVLRKLAEECRQYAKRLVETTPAWLDFVIGTQYCEALIKAVAAASNGQGSLVQRQVSLATTNPISPYLAYNDQARIFCFRPGCR